MRPFASSGSPTVPRRSGATSTPRSAARITGSIVCRGPTMRSRAYLADPEVSLWLMTVAGRRPAISSSAAIGPAAPRSSTSGCCRSSPAAVSAAFLLTAAVERAWSSGTERVWLHTNTLDHPAALPNYLKRGFRAFHSETYTPGPASAGSYNPVAVTAAPLVSFSRTHRRRPISPAFRQAIAAAVAGARRRLPEPASVLDRSAGGVLASLWDFAGVRGDRARASSRTSTGCRARGSSPTRG